MIIETYHLIEGARQADGLAVIIDVFRAFSLECYLFAAGAGEIRPVGSVEITEENGYISFLYKQDINDLVEALTHYSLDDLQITLPSLGDALVRYYEKKLEQENGGDY